MAASKSKEPSKRPSGGAVALTGFLYQILASLDWAAKAHIHSLGSGMPALTILIEPAGGGDLQISAGHRRTFIQFKTRAQGRSWTQRELIKDVLPDLYLAVPADSDEQAAEYVFQTNGVLSSEISLEGATDQRILDEVAASVRRRASARNEPEELTRTKVRHLLAGLNLRGGLSKARLEEQVDALLRDLVDEVEHVTSKRRELVATLVEWAAKGPFLFTPKELLRAVGLTARPFALLGELRGRLALLQNERISRPQVAYKSEWDVRPGPQLPAGLTVAVITGESGVGKTWQLARLAAEEPGLVIWVPAAESWRATLEDAAHLVWNTALGHDGHLSLDRVAARFREVHPGAQQPWLTVCVDGLSRVEHAVGLADADWEAWGARLVMTAPLEVARALEQQRAARVAVVEVTRFRRRQAREYLERRGRRWLNVPRELQPSLELPLLARYFCDLWQADGWSPETEYEVLSVYWSRMATEGQQAHHPGDEAALKSLAGTLIGGAPDYPWPADILAAHGIGDECRARLERVGWLARSDGGGAEVPHDRLLNWSVAAALESQWRLGRVSDETAAALLERTTSGSIRAAGRHLGFVLLDFLWLACSREPSRAAQLLVELEKALGDQERFYARSLATLRSKVVPTLKHRALLMGDEVDRFLAHCIAQALGRIAESRPDEVQACALDCLRANRPMAHAVAVRVLARVPSDRAVDRLWGLLCDAADRVAGPRDANDVDDYEWLARAMRACVRLNPDWLREEIERQPTQGLRLGELGFLLAGIHEQPEARKIWKATKQRLLSADPPLQLRAAARCVELFGDTDEAPRLEQWVSEKEGWLAGVAFSALAEVAPEQALAALPRLDSETQYVTRGWYLPRLLVSHRSETAEAIGQLIRTSAQPWRAANVFQGRENEVDAITVDFLLDRFEADLQQSHHQGDGPQAHQFWTQLERLAGATRFELIERVRSRAGGPLEQALADVACSWVGRTNGMVDHDLRHAQTLLLRMGGFGLTRLINTYLSHNDWLWRLEGYRCAAALPNDETLKLVRRAAELPPPSPGQGETYDSYFACEVLSDVGDLDALSAAISRLGLQTPLHLTEDRLGPGRPGGLAPGETLRALGQAPPGTRSGAILAAAVCCGQEGLESLLALAGETDLGRDEALALTHAFRLLKPDTPDVVQFLTAEIRTDHRWAARQALLGIGTPAALAALASHLLEWCQSKEQVAADEIWLLRVLLRRGVRAEDVRRTLVSLSRTERVVLSHPELMAELAVAGDEHALEWAWERAQPGTEPSWPGPVETLAAIRVLAASDPEAARAAVRRLLSSDSTERDRVASLAVQHLGGTWAVATLTEHACRERSSLCRRAIGLALRELNGDQHLAAALERLMASDQPEDRAAGCELSGWQPDDFAKATLRLLALEDASERVRHAALEALNRQQREQWVAELLCHAADSSGCRLWALVEAACQLGEPELLNSNSDRLSVWKALEGAPHALRALTSKSIEDRQAQIRRDAEWDDRRQEQGS